MIQVASVFIKELLSRAMNESGSFWFVVKSCCLLQAARRRRRGAGKDSRLRALCCTDEILIVLKAFAALACLVLSVTDLIKALVTSEILAVGAWMKAALGGHSWKCFVFQA